MLASAVTESLLHALGVELGRENNCILLERSAILKYFKKEGD
jgi:hypothetical protein